MRKTEGIDFSPKPRDSLGMSKIIGKSQAVQGNPQHTLLPRILLLQEALLDCLDPLGTYRNLVREESWENSWDPREAGQTEIREGRIVGADGRRAPKVKESTERDREERGCGFGSQLGIWISPIFPLMPFFLFQGPTQDPSLL